MSIRTKTILGIAVIEIALLMVLTFYAMSFLSQSNEKQLIQRANGAATMFSHAAKNAVLSTDLATLNDLIDEFIQLEDVAYVRVLRNGREMAHAGDKDLLARQMIEDRSLDDVSDGIFDVRVPISVGTTEFATVDIGFETAPISAMLSEAKQAIIAIASIEVVLVALFSFVLGTYLTRSLTRLATAAHTLGQSGPGFQLNDQRPDELGDVARAFDSMSAKLEKDYIDLNTARADAEQASSSKSRFLASMSHEIRTPMNGVLGILNILEETNLTKEQQKLVNTATESGHFLLSVINDILDFTRMESNTLILENRPFDLHRCITSVTDSFYPTARAQGLVLHCYIEPAVPVMVLGDKNRVKQILLNLIGNAVKFTHEGSIRIHVSSIASESSHATIKCKISDTGIGISKNAIDYLFDEFTMVDQSYSRSKEGSGLGLAICKRLCNLMDGDVNVQSEPDVGSTFAFTIQLELADEESSTSESNENTKTAVRDDLAILVAEDNKANQLVIKEMFKRLNLKIDIAENGHQAVNQVKQYNYDLIFMDISMPKMDGIQACQAIRAMPDARSASTPIIALTAHSLAGDKEKFLACGMDDYISKPLRLSQLVEKIDLFTNKSITKATQASEDTSIVNMQQDVTLTDETSMPNIDTHPIEKDTINLELVDEAILQQMIEDTSADVIPLLIDHYLEESHQRLEKIYLAMDNKDKETLEFEAHTLGSSSLALGNRTLSNLARKIEHQCLDGQCQLAFELKEELQQVANDSLEALEQRKKKGFTESTK
ncbi:response regulator [Vibrio sp. 16]|uniref:HAMP domain-containing hybrid sensor histidine kinase/response regulator n=1 Tax=Vibrio sp. 16 TaxID=391586 RepID=UPI00018F29FC|nr:response regulator [Vibrio sp. 16]EED26085.1 sensor protein GacS [Vibrio sp. 16]CAK4068045.1 Sensor histidine kinase RcsC [Vibrio sp. 16]